MKVFAVNKYIDENPFAVTIRITRNRSNFVFYYKIVDMFLHIFACALERE